MNLKLNLIILLISFPFSFSIMASEAKPSINNIVVFGDSLSDNGNYLRASKSSDNPMPLEPYYQGRASNGMVWAEYLSISIRAKLDDRAYLGALTSGMNPRYPAAVDLLEQIDTYLKNLKGKKLDSKNTLYVVWAGANNIFTMDLKEPVKTIKSLWNITGDIEKGIEKLKENGARYILVSNLPDLGKIALTTDVDSFKNMKLVLSTIVKIENFALLKRINYLRSSHKGEEFKLLLFDAKNMLLEIEKKPSKYNLKNSSNSCYVGVPSNPPTPNVACTNPKDYLFWDLVHPTTKIHCIAANDIQKKLADDFKLAIPSEENYKKCGKY
jgi:thermolabile hemolysin